MSVLVVFRVALKALARNKMRTSLTMLGMIIGVAAVITMVALGQGAQQEIETQIQAAGTNITVRAGSFRRGGISMGMGQSPRLKDNLFGEGVDPVGARIRIRNQSFQVLGVMAAKGSGQFGEDQDDAIFVPYTTVNKKLRGRDGTNISEIAISAASADRINATADEIAGVLREEHDLGPGEDDDFLVRTQEDMTSMRTQTMTGLPASIAGVSLLVGGIGIMNIMLVSVTERTREIGLRMAVGAKGRDVLLQFLVQAMTAVSVLALAWAAGIGLVMASAILGTGEPEELILERIDRTPVNVLAPAIDMDVSELVDRLGNDGFVVDDPGMSIRQLAARHGAETDDVLLSVLQ